VESNLEKLLKCEDDEIAAGLCRMLASTLNKRTKDLRQFIDFGLETFWNQVILNETTILDERLRAIRATGWIARGLVVCSDPAGLTCASRLIGILKSPELGSIAARTLGIIANQTDELLSKKNFAIIKVLHKQRFFSSVLRQIVAGYKAAPVDQQGVYLVALTVLLPHMPKQIGVTELAALMPLLLLALELPEDDLRACAIASLSDVVKESPDLLSNHANRLVSSLLRNSLNGEASTRLAALNCLAAFPDHLPHTALRSHKRPVLKELAIALDDKRQAIRRQSVDTRSKWYLIPS